MSRAPVTFADVLALADWVDGRGYIESAKMLMAVADELEALRKASASATSKADEPSCYPCGTEVTAEEVAAIERIGRGPRIDDGTYAEISQQWSRWFRDRENIVLQELRAAEARQRAAIISDMVAILHQHRRQKDPLYDEIVGYLDELTHRRTGGR